MSACSPCPRPRTSLIASLRRCVDCAVVRWCAACCTCASCPFHFRLRSWREPRDFRTRSRCVLCCAVVSFCCCCCSRKLPGLLASVWASYVYSALFSGCRAAVCRRNCSARDENDRGRGACVFVCVCVCLCVCWLLASHDLSLTLQIPFAVGSGSTFAPHA